MNLINLKLDKRLLSIQDRITKKNSIICDIGCDHCYTGIYSLLNKNALFVYNIDNKKSPLLSGIENIKKFNLLEKTKNIIANGLNTNEIKQKIDYCVMSGIGGKNIVNILTNKNENITIDTYLCLCNDNPHLLREYIKQNNFFISYEDIIISTRNSKKYFFSLIEFSKKKTNYLIENNIDMLIGPYNIKNINQNVNTYIDELIGKYSKLCKYKNNDSILNDLIKFRKII